MIIDTHVSTVDMRDLFGRTPLFCAIIFSIEYCAKILLDTGRVDLNAIDSPTTRLLIAVTKWDSINIIKMLLNAPGIDVDVQDGNKRTARSIALSLLPPGLLVPIVELPIQKGKADPKVPDCFGQTAIDIFQARRPYYHRADTHVIERLIWLSSPTICSSTKKFEGLYKSQLSRKLRIGSSAAGARFLRVEIGTYSYSRCKLINYRRC